MDTNIFSEKTVQESSELSLDERLVPLTINEYTPLELAKKYEEDGKVHFEKGKYRLAIYFYTQGIKVKCEDKEVIANLYSHRAVANYRRRKCRTALYDSEKALSFNGSHVAARQMAAKAALLNDSLTVCVDHCKMLLESQPDNREMQLIFDTAKQKLAAQEKTGRKSRNEKKEQINLVINAIKERGIKIRMDNDEDDFGLPELEPNFSDSIVHLHNGILKWPVLFLYPEFKVIDIAQELAENVPLECPLREMFKIPREKGITKYTCKNINVYYDGSDNKLHIADISKDLREILTSPYLEVEAGTPTFYILLRGSEAESEFLENY